MQLSHRTTSVTDFAPVPDQPHRTLQKLGFSRLVYGKWLDDITDWAELELPRVVHLAEDRREFSDRSFIESSKLHPEYDTPNSK